MSLFAEVFRQGGTVGWCWSTGCMVGRGGFSFEEVSVPVHLWHGEEDLVVSMHHAEDVASRLPDAKLHKLEGTGHFSIQQHYGTVLDTLLAEQNCSTLDYPLFAKPHRRRWVLRSRGA